MFSGSNTRELTSLLKQLAVLLKDEDESSRLLDNARILSECLKDLCNNAKPDNEVRGHLRASKSEFLFDVLPSCRITFLHQISWHITEDNK